MPADVSGASRSILISLTACAKQRSAVRAVVAREEEKAGQKLAVAVEPLVNFWSAEEYHQKYLEKNPGGYCHIPDSYFHLNE